MCQIILQKFIILSYIIPYILLRSINIPSSFCPWFPEAVGIIDIRFASEGPEVHSMSYIWAPLSAVHWVLVSEEILNVFPVVTQSMAVEHQNAIPNLSVPQLTHRIIKVGKGL